MFYVLGEKEEEEDIPALKIESMKQFKDSKNAVKRARKDELEHPKPAVAT